MLFVLTRKCHLSLANFYCQRLTKPARIEHANTNYIQHRDNPTSQQSACRALPPNTCTHYDKLPQTAEILETVLGNMSNGDLLHKPITPNDGCQVGTGAPTPSNQPTVSLINAAHITLLQNSAPISIEI